MAKQTKRTRKFVAKGGIKAALEKQGSVTKKGKLRMKRRRGKMDATATVGGKGGSAAAETAATKREEERKRKRDEGDFAGTGNLGDMDMDSFFRSVAEDVDEKTDRDGSDVDDDDNDEEENMEMPDSDDDDEEEEEERDADSGDDDEEEDVEAAERRMKREMEKLERSDPEFHKFLKENEKSLLDFGQDDDESEKGEEDESDDEAEDLGDHDDDDSKERDGSEGQDKEGMKEKDNMNNDEMEKTSAPDSSYVQLTATLLSSYEKSAFKAHGLKGLRRIVSAYRSACHLSDAQSREGAMAGTSTGNKKSYHIDSSIVFDRLMVISLTKCHEEFHYHLLGEGKKEKDTSISGKKDGQNKKKQKTADDEEENQHEEDEPANDVNQPIKPTALAKSHRWSMIKPILQNFLRSTLHMLNEAKEPKLLTFILQSLSNYIQYLTPFPKLGKTYLKALTSLWSAPLDSSPDYQVVRLNAFIRIRQMALTQPFPFIEQCLRATYLAYAKRARFGTASSVTTLLPTLTFMGNCVVELYSLDYHSSYQHAFVYIRQLALHLRSALQKRTPEAIRVVYCWQYVHCLRLWVAVLSSSCTQGNQEGGGANDEEAMLLRSLIFPLTEVIHGTVRLVPTVRHLPLRLHCVRLLQQLASSAELYIPTTSILLDVLDLKEIYMKPKHIKNSKGGKGKSDIRGIRLPLVLKLPKNDTLRTSEQLEACLSETFVLLNREVDLYKYSAGFPEFTVRICQRLRRFSKETKNSRWRAFAKGCIELCERLSESAIKARSALNEAPKDIKRLEVLRPSNVPSMRERYEASVSKEKRLEAASQPALSEAAKEKARLEATKAKETEDSGAKEKEDTVRSKKKKKVTPVNDFDLKNTDALEEEDEVKEGIDWSDNEDEKDERDSKDSSGEMDDSE